MLNPSLLYYLMMKRSETEWINRICFIDFLCFQLSTDVGNIFFIQVETSFCTYFKSIWSTWVFTKNFCCGWEICFLLSMFFLQNEINCPFNLGVKNIQVVSPEIQSTSRWNTKYRWDEKSQVRRFSHQQS